MKKIMLGLMFVLATSLNTFAEDQSRFDKEFAVFSLVGDCVYGTQDVCESSILKALRLGATEKEIISAVTREVGKMKEVDRVPVEATKERLKELFIEADKEFNSNFKESLEMIANR